MKNPVRLWALLLKEFKQTLRNKHLLYLLIVPPVIQLLVLGASLDPQLHHVRLAFCDESCSSAGRSLRELLSATNVFELLECSNQGAMYSLIEQKKASASILVPAVFEKSLLQHKKADVYINLDGSDAYTANVVKEYLDASVARFNQQYLSSNKPRLQAEVLYLYNRGLRASWYFIPGLLGAIITVVGVLVSSAVLLREKERGTLEQLLMTPARSWEIVLAKILPIYSLLLLDLCLGILLSMAIFSLPFRGNLILFFFGSSFYILIAIGAGLTLGTFCKTQRQAQLCSFFISIPVVQLSGSVVPAESMPRFMQMLSVADPLKYFSFFTRSILLKGAEFYILQTEFIVLFIFAIVMIALGTIRFRNQLE